MVLVACHPGCERRGLWRGEDAGTDGHHAGLGVALSVAMANALGLRLSHALEGGDVVATLGDFDVL